MLIDQIKIKTNPVSIYETPLKIDENIAYEKRMHSS